MPDGIERGQMPQRVERGINIEVDDPVGPVVEGLLELRDGFAGVAEGGVDRGQRVRRHERVLRPFVQLGDGGFGAIRL